MCMLPPMVLQYKTTFNHTPLALSSQAGSPGSMQNVVDLYWTQIADRDTSLISQRLPAPNPLTELECIGTFVWDYDIWPWYVRNLSEAFWEEKGEKMGRLNVHLPADSNRTTLIPGWGGAPESQLFEGEFGIKESRNYNWKKQFH